MSYQSLLASLVLFSSSSLLADTVGFSPVAVLSKNKQSTTPATAEPLLPCNSPALCSIGNGVVLSGSFLWWRASENLEEYARVVTKDNLLSLDEARAAPKGHNQFVSYQWAPGFNVRAGWDTNYDCWDLFADWTWYQNSTTNHIHAKTDSALIADLFSGTENALGIYNTWGQSWIPAHVIDNREGLPFQSVLEGPFKKAKVNWRLSYNTFNLELGKSFKTTANLLRPFFGLRGALIERTAKSRYTEYQNLGSLLTPTIALGADDAPFTVEGFNSAQFKTHMNFWGLGPLLGIMDEFRLPHGWRLMGQFAASFFYGRIHSADKYSLFSTINQVPTLFAGTKFTDHAQWSPVTNLQIRFGIDWATCFNQQHNEFLIGAAWEENIWFFHGYSSDVNQGIMNLGLGGLTATLQFKF